MDYIKSGDKLKASWANDVVSSIRSIQGNPAGKRTGRNADMSPFDPIYLGLSANDWVMKIQKALHIDKGGASNIEFESKSLNDYPVIKIEPDKDLYFNYKDKSLIWDEPDSIFNIKILQFTYNGEEFEIFNEHPNHVDIRNLPPFSPLFSKNKDGDITVKLTDGVISEVVTADTATALIDHKPTNIDDDQPIEIGQQLTLKFETDKKGNIDSETVELLVEDIDVSSSIHYIPPCAGDSGRNGEYFYKMLEVESISAIKIFNAGSNISFFHEVPEINNTSGSGSEIVKEYEINENRFSLRTIDAKGQLDVSNDDDTVYVRGNSLSGEYVFRRGSEELYPILKYDDGLIIEPEGKNIIDLTTITAGDNVQVVQAGSNYTISVPSSAFDSESSSLSGKNLNLSLWTVLLGSDEDGHLIWQSKNLDYTLYFRNGVYVGDVDPGDSPTSLDEYSVSNVSLNA